MILKPQNQPINSENIEFLVNKLEEFRGRFVRVKNFDGNNRIIFDFTVIESEGFFQISYFDGREPRTIKNEDEVFLN